MINLQFVDVAVGLFFVYLALSLIASAISELMEGVLRTRAKYLWQGIGELLGDRPLRSVRVKVVSRMTGHVDTGQPTGEVMTLGDVYRHPILDAQFFGDYSTARSRAVFRTLPSYIAPRDFAAVLIDCVLVKAGKSRMSTEVSSIERLRRSLDGLPDTDRLVIALRTIVRGAGDDMSAVTEAVEQWYESAMERVTGWYQRHVRCVLFMVGLALAVILNADSIQIATYLSSHEMIRDAWVEAALGSVAGGEPTLDVLRHLGALGERGSLTWASSLGYLLTAAAVSLGAPFWFDVISKVASVRSSLKPTSKPGPSEGQPATAELMRG